MRPALGVLGIVAAGSMPALRAAEATGVVRVGAKNFTEQQILGEMVAQLLTAHTDLRVERRFGLAGTGVCHAALLAGELDLYVEYTGTAVHDVLQAERQADSAASFRFVSRAYRERFDLTWLPPLGFNNTYALAVRPEPARAHGWRSISDLAPAAAALAAGFTSEFVERPDGYPGLQRAYDLSFGSVRDVDPGLLYDALLQGQVDVISAFATDGRLEAYQLNVLEDDRRFFPAYDAAPVMRGALLRAHPEIADALSVLTRALDEATMRRLNARTDINKVPPRQVAAEWLGLTDRAEHHRAGQARGARPGLIGLAMERRAELLRKLMEHLWLTAAAMALATAIGVPLGITLSRYPALAPAAIAATEIVQTIPSLAMLAFLFSMLGVLGALPAVAALLLYALLPIVVGTYTSLRQVAPELIEAADGLGMTGWQRLGLVELPLASPVIVAGLRTAAVWTVGIATLSTYIGAGGLGDFISRGLARNDTTLTLLGAVPAALLAVVLSLIIRQIERMLSAPRRA